MKSIDSALASAVPISLVSKPYNASEALRQVAVDSAILQWLFGSPVAKVRQQFVGIQVLHPPLPI